MNSLLAAAEPTFLPKDLPKLRTGWQQKILIMPAIQSRVLKEKRGGLRFGYFFKIFFFIQTAGLSACMPDLPCRRRSGISLPSLSRFLYFSADHSYSKSIPFNYRPKLNLCEKKNNYNFFWLLTNILYSYLFISPKSNGVQRQDFNPLSLKAEFTQLLQVLNIE